MRKKSYFKTLYNFDKESNSYFINVSLDNYDDVYDDWDPSPFKKRDIEVEFNDFIVNSSEDIPLKYKTTIVLHLPQSKKDENKETALKSAYQNFYSYALQRLNKSLSNLYRKITMYFTLSLLFLTVGYFFFKEDQNVFLDVLHEGIFIGGWVFLWEFFTEFFITRRKIVEEYKLYERLYSSEIRFVYS
jgi:hypothetical protein